ncbi:MAG: molybdopterin-binding oxidoreductase [Chloroflexi bacterium]|nr:molybdopterin-binding oxidoreductase [Chloroflexota bacterium]MDL1883774.1 molybdopterin-binding oxidoreductase [Anaerolineae bacterium CFX8]
MGTKTSTGTIIWAGILLAAALTALLFAGAGAVGTPFPAFDLFDLTARALPGGLLTFGIDLMVDTIRALNLGPTDDTAKLAEQLMAVGLFVLLAAVSSVIYFSIARRTLARSAARRRGGLLSGLVLGGLFGLPMMAISASLNLTATAAPVVSLAWLAAVFAGWGLAAGYTFYRLSAMSPTAETEASATALNRRQFLIQLGSAAATITVVGAGLGALLRNTPSAPPEEPIQTNAAALPNVDNAVSPAPGTRPEYTPLDQHYRIDINTGGPPRIDLENYTLKITGLVEEPLELTLDEIQGYEPMSQYITMSCISNRLAGDLISTTLWTGTSMQRILERVKPLPEAAHIKIKAADGFDEVVALDVIRQDERVMLTYAWDNEPLRERHGAPLRIHIPDLYGMKQPKWITEMEFISAWEEGYWVRRGWDKEARVRATSVIDTVAAEAAYKDSDRMLIPIGGIAWAGARGIARVEVQVDGGDWVEAQLRSPLSDKTWVIWRYDWPFEAGEHRFAVRCIESDGTPQIEMVAGVRPSGATGIHSVSKTV